MCWAKTAELDMRAYPKAADWPACRMARPAFRADSG